MSIIIIIIRSGTRCNKIRYSVIFFFNSGLPYDDLSDALKGIECEREKNKHRSLDRSYNILLTKNRVQWTSQINVSQHFGSSKN